MTATSAMTDTSAHTMAEPTTATMGYAHAVADAATKVVRGAAAQAVGEAVAEFVVLAYIIRTVAPIVGCIPVIPVVIGFIGVSGERTAIRWIVYVTCRATVVVSIGLRSSRLGPTERSCGQPDAARQ
jgi:hypothetical protein